MPKNPKKRMQPAPPFHDPSPLTHVAMGAMATSADLDNRRIYLVGEVDDDMASRVLIQMDILNRKEGPISVFLCSPGGSVPAGFAIYEAFRLSPNPVTIIGFGEVMSAATLIMQGGHSRFLTPTVRFMIHDISMGVCDSLKGRDFTTYGKEIAVLTDNYAKALSERSKLSVKDIKAMMRTETFMDAQTTAEHGLVDGLVTGLLPNVTPQPVTRKKRKAKKKAKR